MKKISKFFFMSALALAMFSCEKKEEDNEPQIDPNNESPTVYEQKATAVSNKVTEINVLNNAWDTEQDSLFITKITGAQNGVATTNGSVVIYTSNEGYIGEEVLTFSVSDGNTSVEETLTVTVTANEAPNAVRDYGYTDVGGSVTIDLLENDSDPEKEELIILSISTPSNGTAKLVGNSVVYTPSTVFAGRAYFNYTVTDGINTTEGEIYVQVGFGAAKTTYEELDHFLDEKMTISWGRESAYVTLKSDGTYTREGDRVGTFLNESGTWTIDNDGYIITDGHSYIYTTESEGSTTQITFDSIYEYSCQACYIP